MQQEHIENLSDVIDSMSNIENELYSVHEFIRDEQRAAWAVSSISAQRLEKLHDEVERLRDQLEILETITYRDVRSSWKARITSFFRTARRWKSGRRRGLGMGGRRNATPKEGTVDEP